MGAFVRVTRWPILAVVAVLIALAPLVPAIGVKCYQLRHRNDSLCETGYRIAYIKGLLRYGSPGAAAARDYILHSFWQRPPSPYDIGMVAHSDAAFRGQSESQIVNDFGAPDETARTPTMITYTYRAKSRHNDEDLVHVMRVTFIEGRVENIVRVRLTTSQPTTLPAE